MGTKEKYPAPHLPPGYEAEFMHTDHSVWPSYWAIKKAGSFQNVAWLDCTDAPNYSSGVWGWGDPHTAKTYNEAKAHIEALAALGEL